MQLKQDPRNKAPSLHANAAVFLMFFGVALVTAIGKMDWRTAMFWMVLLLLFLLASRRPDGAP